MRGGEGMSPPRKGFLHTWRQDARPFMVFSFPSCTWERTYPRSCTSLPPISNFTLAMSNSHMFFCLEILGESAFHKYLVQSGWSGRAYVFRYNQPTHSHLRAYRSIEDYYAERVDIHKAANIWPLLGNLLPEDQIEPHVFADSLNKTEPASEPGTAKRKGRTPHSKEL